MYIVLALDGSLPLQFVVRQVCSNMSAHSYLCAFVYCLLAMCDMCYAAPARWCAVGWLWQYPPLAGGTAGVGHGVIYLPGGGLNKSIVALVLELLPGCHWQVCWCVTLRLAALLKYTMRRAQAVVLCSDITVTAVPCSMNTEIMAGYDLMLYVDNPGTFVLVCTRQSGCVAVSLQLACSAAPPVLRGWHSRRAEARFQHCRLSTSQTKPLKQHVHQHDAITTHHTSVPACAPP